MSNNVCNSYVFNGQTYAASGVYTQTFSNLSGCDSNVILNLVVNQSTNIIINQTDCTSFTLNGQTYNSSGIYVQPFVNIHGCDSLVTLNLTILGVSNSTLNQTSCSNYTLNGQTYTSTGSYNQLLSTSFGCDSIITLNLIVSPIVTTVTQSGFSLTSNQAGATYQWIRCGNNTIIAGATNQGYSTLIGGSYAVIVNYNACVDTSECKTIFSLGTTDDFFSNDLIISPNPSNGIFNIELIDPKHDHLSLTVYDLLGKIVYSRSIEPYSTIIPVDISKEAKGIYFVEITQGNHRYRAKVNIK